MKRILVSIFAVALTMGIASAQNLEEATNLFNSAATLLSQDNNEGALDAFKNALTMAEALGADGSEIAAKCKEVIPSLNLRIGKALASAQKTEEAVAKLKETIEVAKAYNDEETAAEASGLIPQLLMAKANSLLNEKKFAEAVNAYKDIVTADPGNGVALLRLGMSLASSGDADGAVEFLEKAMGLGQEAAAAKQLSNIFLKKASACQKAKDMKGVLENAQKSAQYGDNANAQKLIGISALALKQNKMAADAFEAYLAMSPSAKDKVQITYQLGTALVAAGDNSKACGYFKQIAQDPQFGEAAKYQLTTLKCQ